jgi:predicted DNA-binding transcriptional regulator YafY
VRADRLVSLALLLQARGRMSARVLAAELEVSVRTVYRDIEALNAAGVPVVTETGPRGGCWLLDGYRFPLRGLSADEAGALLVLGVPAAIADLGLGDALAAAQRKIGAAAAGAVPPSAPVLVHLDMPRWFHASEPVPHLPTLAEAVRRCRTALIGYQRGADGAEKDRTVQPLGLVNKAGTWYLVASTTGRDDRDPAVYRAGRITSVRLPGDSFRRPAGFELTSFWEKWSDSFVISLQALEVRARASAAALAVFPLVFGNPIRPVLAAAGPPDEAGWREVTLRFEDEVVAAHRLAGFGGQVEVLSPASVRDGLVSGARELLACYQAR